MENQPNRLLSRIEAAEYLGVSVSWLKAQAAANTGPSYYKVGKLAKYSPADLATWLADQRVASPVELLTVRYPADCAVDQGDQAG